MHCERASDTIIRFRRDELSGQRPLLRLLVFIRDRWECVYCNRSLFRDGVTLHVDHVRPTSRGGTQSLDNLVTACAECNLSKGADELTPPKLNEVRKTTWANSDWLYRYVGSSIPPIAGRPIYDSPIVRTDADMKQSRTIAEWMSLELRDGAALGGRSVGRMFCFHCDNDFPARIAATGSHQATCLWNYYAACCYCRYKNNLAKYLDGAASCICNSLLSRKEMRAVFSNSSHSIFTI